jgi:hypothetical protein
MGMTRSPARIILHVERLVLHGIDPRDRAAIGAAVRQELSRLLAEQGVPPGWQDAGPAQADRLATHLPRTARPASATATGTAVARAAFAAEGRRR